MTNKTLYSLTVLCVKILPVMYSLAVLVNINLSYFEIGEYIITIFNQLFILGYLGIFMLYILSKTYRFCIYHQTFIYYLLINKLLMTYDKIYTLPLSDWNLYVLYTTISGIFLFLILYLHQRYGTRRKEKYQPDTG